MPMLAANKVLRNLIPKTANLSFVENEDHFEAEKSYDLKLDLPSDMITSSC